MAASSDVAAFRAAGNSVSSTASHFGVSERAVYKACQAHAARLRRGVARVASSSSARLTAAGSSMFPDLGDDVAGSSTYWRCPVTHELLPVVPGSRRLEWMRERESLYARLRSAPPAVVEVSAPLSELLSDLLSSSEPTREPTREPTFEALESDIEPTEPVVAAVVLPIVAQHNKRLSVNPPRVDWSVVTAWLSTWMAEYWRVPLALAVAVLLIMLSR
jgi:hypothetical protein